MLRRAARNARIDRLLAGVGLLAAWGWAADAAAGSVTGEDRTGTAARAHARPARSGDAAGDPVGDAAGAPAELALGEAQLELAPRGELFDLFDQDATGQDRAAVRMAGFAQLTGGGEGGGDLGAGAAVAVPGIGCDLLYGAAQGRLRPLAEERVVGDARYRVCVARRLVTIDFDGRRGVGLAPALDARRSLWRRRYDLSYDRVTVGGGELGRGAHHHSILVMAFGHGVVRQADGDAQRTMKQVDFDVAVYRDRYAGRGVEARVDVMAISGDAMKAGDSDLGGIAVAYEPVRVAVTGDGWFASAHAGWGVTGGELHASGSTEVNGQTTSSWSESFDGTGLPELTTLVGEVAAGARRGACEASASLGRQLYPTFDGDLSLEERAAGSVACAVGRRGEGSVRVSPFAARTRTWIRDTGAGGGAMDEISAGASIAAGRELGARRAAGGGAGARLRIDAIGEVGVTPYARLDGARAPDSQLGGRLLVALSGVAGR